MNIIIPLLLAIIAGSVFIIILMALRNVMKNSGGKTSNDKLQKKGKTVVIKEAQKRLSHDPHNVSALETLGDIYYADGDWENSYNVYKTLYSISAAHVEIDIARAAMREGISAYKLDKIDESINALMVSAKKVPDTFDTNYYLGMALYKKGVYEKAAFCFKKARIIQPENPDVLDMLGSSLFKAQKYKDALPFLKRSFDERPGNKDALYNMAVSMTELGMSDKALKLFMHLRPDPKFGPQACLEAGKIHERSKQYKEAIQDYEIALKFQNIQFPLKIQIKYRCANAYISENNISKGYALLKQVQTESPGYKDVDALVVRYAELNQNRNLQVYMMSGTSDFVALCRKFVSAYYPDSFVKFEDMSIASESVEMICAIESAKWEAREIFRFYRTMTVIGDIYVREFHSKMRDSKCDAGLCVTMGSFSDSAHKYAEGRPIDLIEKDQLSKILKKINMFS
mgnify:CR=1 FL=1